MEVFLELWVYCISSDDLEMLPPVKGIIPHFGPLPSEVEGDPEQFPQGGMKT